MQKILLSTVRYVTKDETPGRSCTDPRFAAYIRSQGASHPLTLSSCIRYHNQHQQQSDRARSQERLGTHVEDQSRRPTR